MWREREREKKESSVRRGGRVSECGGKGQQDVPGKGNGYSIRCVVDAFYAFFTHMTGRERVCGVLSVCGVCWV